MLAPLVACWKSKKKYRHQSHVERLGRAMYHKMCISRPQDINVRPCIEASDAPTIALAAPYADITFSEPLFYSKHCATTSIEIPKLQIHPDLSPNHIFIPHSDIFHVN